MNNNYKIPIGIVSVFWDYDEIDETKEAFYELDLIMKGDKFEYINNFYFLNNNICTSYEKSLTENFKIILLEIYDNKKIKIQICGDIIYLNKKQYLLLNENITKLQEKLNFEIEILDKTKKSKNNYF